MNCGWFATESNFILGTDSGTVAGLAIVSKKGCPPSLDIAANKRLIT